MRAKFIIIYQIERLKICQLLRCFHYMTQ